jgi:hypothetical protein
MEGKADQEFIRLEAMGPVQCQEDKKKKKKKKKFILGCEDLFF